MLRRVTNLVDLVFLGQDKHLILLAQHEFQPFLPLVTTSAFDVLTLSCRLGSFVIFVLQLVLKTIINSLHLVLVLEYKDLIMLVDHDSQQFPPSMKRSAFAVLTLFVIMDNFVIFFYIFRIWQVLYQDRLISVQKDYQFISFSPSTARHAVTPAIASIP